MRLPSCVPLCVGLLAALGPAALPGPARPQVRSCFVHATRPFLLGFSFRVADIGGVDAWAERFGFGPLDPPVDDGSGRALRLRQGMVWWSSRPIESFEDLDGRIGVPVSKRLYYYGPTAPPDEPIEQNVPVPPNGALRPIRAIAIVEDGTRLVDAFTFRHPRDPDRPTQYAGNFRVPEIGALAHDVRYDSGYYRFLFATDSTGTAARWLAEGPPRWVGVAFQVGDLAATERALAARGIPTLRVHEHIGEAAWVMPEVTGGPLLEFVETSTR